MQAKHYLNKNWRLQCLYDAKTEQLKNLRELLTSSPSPMAPNDKIQSSQNLHRQEDKICEIVDLEAQLQKDLKDIIAFKLELTKKINELSNIEHKLILNLRYLNFMSWEQIACEMNISFRWAMSLHKKALIEFEEMHFK